MPPPPPTYPPIDEPPVLGRTPQARRDAVLEALSENWEFLHHISGASRLTRPDAHEALLQLQKAGLVEQRPEPKATWDGQRWRRIPRATDALVQETGKLQAHALLVEMRAWVPAEHLPAVLLGIARSVTEAHRHGPDRWGLRAEDSIMLKVGRHEVMQVGPWQIPCQVIVVADLVPEELRSMPGVWFSGSNDWRGNPGATGYYLSHPGTEACRFGFPLAERLLSALADAHFTAIERAARLPRHSTTERTHAPDFIDMLARETGFALPQPLHALRPKHAPEAQHPPVSTSSLSRHDPTTLETRIPAPAPLGRSCWWLGVNNSRGRNSRGGGHVHFPEIEPFLSGAAETFAWPAGGAPGSGKCYAEVQAGDGVVLWMGDGVRADWGIIGLAEVRDVRQDSDSKVAELILARARPGVLTPYPQRRPAPTEHTAYLLELFGPRFRPLRKLYFRLGHPDVKPCVVTIDRVPSAAYASLWSRLRGVEPGDAATRPPKSTTPTLHYSIDEQTGPPVQWSLVLDADAYSHGLAAIEDRMSPLQRRLLVSHYAAPRKTIYAADLARVAEVVGGHPVVNLQYGRLGRLFAESAELQLDRRKNGQQRLWSVWSRGLPTKNGFMWEMLPAVAKALEQLGWVEGPSTHSDTTPQAEGQPPAGPTRPWLTRRGTTDARPTGPILRGGIPEREVDQEHNRLQIKLFRDLCARFGSDRVLMEADFADITCRPPGGGLDLFEIKSDDSPRRAIRAALGQLIEYSYAALGRGEDVRMLVIAAPSAPDDADARYFAHLRRLLPLDLRYIALSTAGDPTAYDHDWVVDSDGILA